jgi:hypothetical protein
MNRKRETSNGVTLLSIVEERKIFSYSFRAEI